MPGFHSETLADLETQCEKVAEVLRGRMVPRKIAAMDGSFKDCIFSTCSEFERFAQWHFDVPQTGLKLSEEDVAPCALAAFEMALVQVIMRLQADSLPTAKVCI